MDDDTPSGRHDPFCRPVMSDDDPNDSQFWTSIVVWLETMSGRANHWVIKIRQRYDEAFIVTLNSKRTDGKAAR